jgi:hypothetical protein
MSRVNTLQLLALVCLTMISVLNSAHSAFDSAGVDAEQYPALAELLHNADLLMLLLLLPPPLLLLYNTVCAACGAGDGTDLVVVEGDKMNERRRHEENDRALAVRDAEKEQQLAAKDAKIEQLLEEMASLGSKKSSEGASAAGVGADKTGQHQYQTAEQPIQW